MEFVRIALKRRLTRTGYFDEASTFSLKLPLPRPSDGPPPRRMTVSNGLPSRRSAPICLPPALTPGGCFANKNKSGTGSDADTHFRPRRARAQSQGYRRRYPARDADGDHRPVGLGQVLARFRHHLCRGPAPLRRVAVGLRPPVPRDDAEARRRPYRGLVPRHLDRAEDDVA